MKFRLKDFRQAHSLFQSDMATLLDTNQSTVSRMELKGIARLTYPQLQSLYDKYGKDDVDSFLEHEEEMGVVAIGNINEGDGTQNNGYMTADARAYEIIKKQSETISSLAAKQSEQTDRLLTLLEKLSEKL